MIKGLYALPPDVGAYLARIGLAPEDFRRAMHLELPPSPTDYSIPHTKSRWISWYTHICFMCPLKTSTGTICTGKSRWKSRTFLTRLSPPPRRLLL